MFSEIVFPASETAALIKDLLYRNNVGSGPESKRLVVIDNDGKATVRWVEHRSWMAQDLILLDPLEFLNGDTSHDYSWKDGEEEIAEDWIRSNLVSQAFPFDFAPYVTVRYEV